MESAIMLRAVSAGLVASAFIVTTSASASAQTDYPARPVQLVVPFVAGGNTDILSRIVADQLRIAFKQPFTVVNRPGAGANIGAAVVASSDPDGYNILVAPPGPHVLNQFIYRSLPFDPETAFAPITMLASYPNVLVVHPALDVNSIQQLIDKAKASPGSLAYASAGVGATSHLSAALFAAMADIDINHVPYKGTAQSIQDVVAGRVAMTIDNLGPILPFIKSGQLVALGVSTSTPVSLLPDVPPIGTVLKGYEASSWNAMSVRSGTPRPIVDKLSTETIRILQNPEVASRFRAIGSEPVGGTPEEVEKFFAQERIRWKRAVDAAKIPMQ
jgi:tripartite-type tricarboxylate transporter receptor subunit TctC